MGATITVDAHEVYASLALIAAIPKILAPPTKESLDLLKKRMQEYPAPPAGSTYVRTYNLRGGWHLATVVSGNILGRVWNEGVEYADYVQQESTQAEIHQGRWQTEVQVADELEPEIIRIFDAYLDKILK